MALQDPRLGEVLWVEEMLRTLTDFEAKMRELHDTAQRMNADREQQFVVGYHYTLRDHSESVRELAADVLQRFRSSDATWSRWRVREDNKIHP